MNKFGSGVAKYLTVATIAVGLAGGAQATVLSLGSIGGTVTQTVSAADGSIEDFLSFTPANSGAVAIALQSVTFNSYGVTLASLAVYLGTYGSHAALSGATALTGVSSNTSQALWGGITVYAVSQNLASLTGGAAYTIVIGGSSKGASAYTTIVSVAAPTASPAVPEPASWALMVGGFGLVGATMRKRGVTAPRRA